MGTPKKEIKVFYLFLLLFLPLKNYAQKSVSFHNLNMENGLSQNSVVSIAQDKKQFLWFGTRRGLNRYDGSQFKTYTSDPDNPNSLQHNVVDCLLADSHGELWVGTVNGLSRYNNDNDNFIKIRTDNDTINCIYEDSQKNLWVGGYGGLSLLSNRKKGIFKTFRFDKLSQNQRINSIYSIFRDRQENIWLGTGDGLIRMNLKNGKYHAIVFRNSSNDIKSISSNYITSIKGDSSNNIWIGTDKGLNLYTDKKGFIHYNHLSGSANTLIHDDIRDILLNKDGHLWIATQEGLSILNPKTRVFENYKHNPDERESLAQNSLHSIFQDVNGTVWIGSFYGGVDAAFPYSSGFKTYRASGISPSISSNIISSITEDAQHNLYIGTEGGGLNYFNRGLNTFIHYKFKPGNKNALPSNLVKTLFQQKNGNIIIGMHEGLISIFNPSTKSFRHLTNVKDTANTRGSADIMTILEDSEGTTWVGSRDGLNNIDGLNSHAVKSPLEKKLHSRYIQTLLEDRNGNIWIGTTKGLYVYNLKNKSIKCFKKKVGNPDSLQVGYINCIIQTADGKFCIGTYFGGISIFNPKDGKFKTYTEIDGLSNNNVLGIIEDNEHNLWISTDNGLSILNLKKEKFNNYTKSDGLAGNDFNTRSFFKDHNGQFFFGGYNGFTSFYPDQIEINKQSDPVVITELKLFNRRVQVNGTDKLLGKNINATESISFKHNQNNFSIGFALLNYIRSDKNKYSYKLEGYDNAWTSTNTPSAAYSNLPAGRYTFVVKGVNNDGIPGSKTASIIINIIPPFWATWWAYLFYLLVFSSILFLTIRYFFMRALLKRSEDVQKMKLNFFTYIAHEIRTPLTLILAPLDNLAKSSQNNIEINQQVIPIKNNADRLMRLITELMDFRKAETGHLKLHVTKTDIIAYANEMFLAFRYTANKRKIQYRFTHDDDQLMLFFDKMQMEKVLFNLLSNAFKFTKNGGEITLSIQNFDQNVQIKVIDNGNGIPYESQNKLFSDYFQVEEQESTHIGSGIGLALSKSIVEAHKGKIEILSNPASDMQPGYTCFTITLKKGNTHFKPQDFAEVRHTDLIHKLQPEPAVSERTTENDPSGFNETILIVEDNPEIMQLVSGVVSHQYQVKESDNGLQGWQTATELLPDLIICDVMMPIMDGLELCRKLKTDERTSHIPVIILTARSSHIHQLDGLETGADAYITKPFSIDVLLLNVRNLLKSRETMRLKFIQQVNLQPQDITVNSTDHVFLTKVLSFIETHMSDETFGVPELSQKIGMSQPVLYKKIRTMTTLSVNDFIKSIRLKKAAQLLKENRYTISEVSYLVGFNDPKYFSREFRKQHGQTPRDYLKTTTELN